MNTPSKKFGVLATALLFVVSCAEVDSLTSSSTNSSSSRMPNLKVYLTDAPNDNLVSVYVNVKHVEVWLEGKGRSARIITSENLGVFDLLRFQSGALLPLNSLDLPEDIYVKKFRIVLEETGHYATKTDGSRCDMKTPSAQKSGLKINLSQPIHLEKNSGYSIVIDFDAKKSIVQQGNGRCLLKPVLKLKKGIRHDVDDSLNTILSGPISNEDQMDDGDDLLGQIPPDNSTDDSNGGFDYDDPSTWPPEMTPEEFNAMF